MTFRSSARSNVNRYIQAGNAAASAGVEISGGIAANRPRFDKIEDARMQVHADLFKAAIDADAKVAKAGMSIKAAREQRKAKEQAEKKIRASNKSAAMAGKLAAGAQAIGLSQYVKNQKQEENPLYAYFDRTQSRIDSQASADATKQGEGDTRLEDINRQIEILKGGKTNSPAAPKSGPIISSGQALEAGIGTPGKGGRYSQTEMAGFAEQAGFSPEQARIMGAIGMGESGGNAGVDTSMTIDPQKKNEYSIGLFQINAQAHGDKLAKLGYTVDDLRDPVKNAQVAKMVYDEVGGFTPWSVYNDGKYTKFLD
jgi:hypothetical protein